MNDFQNSHSTTSVAPNQNWTAIEIQEWFERREWLNGAPLTPHDSINRAEFAKQYTAHQSRWSKAFDFLRDTDLMNLPPGEYPIDGAEVFAIVAEAEKKNYADTKWESHLKYQDIQMVIDGKEQMGIAPISVLTVTESYDEARDVAFYQGEGTIYTAEPATFFIFFPLDGHRPDIKSPNIERDKKIVIKVRIN